MGVHSLGFGLTRAVDIVQSDLGVLVSNMADLTLLSQLATARISCVGEKAILETESDGGWTSSMSFWTGRKLDPIILGSKVTEDEDEQVKEDPVRRSLQFKARSFSFPPWCMYPRRCLSRRSLLYKHDARDVRG